MPATDALRIYPPCDIEHNVESMADLSPIEPPLTPAERAIVKSYGGWTSFMQSFGLKPWDSDDAEEGKRILEGFVEQDDDDE